jgi:hypothetical protein
VAEAVIVLPEGGRWLAGARRYRRAARLLLGRPRRLGGDVVVHEAQSNCSNFHSTTNRTDCTGLREEVSGGGE